MPAGAKNFSDLTPTTAVTAADEFYIRQSGTTKRFPSAFAKSSGDAAEGKVVLLNASSKIDEAFLPVSMTAATNIIYVSKQGSNTNSGRKPYESILDIEDAIIAASGLTPSATNWITIHVLDGGLYEQKYQLGVYEDGFVIPSYVHLYAPSATLKGVSNVSAVAVVKMSASSKLTCMEIIGFGDAGSGVEFPVSGTARVTCATITPKGGYDTLYGDSGSSGTLHVDIEYLTTSGGGAGLFNDGSCILVGEIDTINIVGNSTGIIASSAITLFIQEMVDDGSGTGIDVGTGANADIHVQYLNCNLGVTGTAGTATVAVGTNASTTKSDATGANIKVVDLQTMSDNSYIKGVTVDGGGSVISTGVKGFIECPFAGEITEVVLLADQSGSMVVDIWKDTYANYPPTVADTITASAKPTLSAAISYKDSTLTGWTKTVAAGDILGFNVDSLSTITRFTLTLKIRKS